MKRIVYLIYMSCFIAISQNAKENDIVCNLLPTIKSDSKMNISLNELSKTDYERYKNENSNEIVLFKNSDSIEKILITKYPKIFFKEDGNILKVKFDGESKYFVNNNIPDKTFSNYSIKGMFKDYFIINEEFYESWSCTVVNVKTNKLYTLPSNPIFINETLFYSYSNYYGEEELKVIDVINNKDFLLTFSNVSFLSFYNSSNHIMFEVECMYSSEKKYLKLLLLP
ncbi:MAG: hypothetical protein L3J14_05490 [Flavobacteriaceae bacterium]|nr:hypothetical protein [Flavobacteriaceae bacterium]